MKNPKSKARNLRIVLSTFVFIAIGLSALGFYFAQDWLGTYAKSVGQTMAKSTINVTGAQGLAELLQALNDKQLIVTKLDSFLSPAQNYQSQIINDLSKYAANSGVTITDYNVSSPNTASTATSTISGVGISYVTITLSNPMQITSFIKFLKLIETNLPKMQLSGISISGETSSTAVTVNTLTIGVYTK